VRPITSIRASALPLAWICPGSLQPCEVPINRRNEPAANGSAAHRVCEALPKTGSCNWDRLHEICVDFGADESEVRVLCALAQKLWPQLAEFFPFGVSEASFSTDMGYKLHLDNVTRTLTGTADLVSAQGCVLRILDWKFGWRDADYGQQMRAYMAVPLLVYPDLERATATIAWARDQQIEHYSMTRDGAHTWAEQLRSNVLSWDGTYHPGDHCIRCNRQHECPAANAIARYSIAAINELDADDACLSIASLTDEQAIDLYGKARTVAHVASLALDAIRSRAMNGPIESGPSRLEIVTEERRELNVLGAWPVLQERLTTTELAQCVKISLSEAESVIAKKAGRGNGAKAKEAFREELDSRELITRKPVHKLVQRRR